MPFGRFNKTTRQQILTAGGDKAPRIRIVGRRKLNNVQKRQVNRIIRNRAEKKFRSIVFTESSFLITPLISKLNFDGTNGVPALGNGDNDRVGDKIEWISLRMQIYIHLNFSATSAHYGRFIIFQWNQNDSIGAPTAATILISGVSGVVDYTSQYAPDFKSLYTILYDRTFTMGFEGANQIQKVLKYVKIKRKSVRFNTGTANNSTNSLYYMILGDGISVESGTIFGSFMLRYIDV